MLITSSLQAQRYFSDGGDRQDGDGKNGVPRRKKWINWLASSSMRSAHSLAGGSATDKMHRDKPQGRGGLGLSEDAPRHPYLNWRPYCGGRHNWGCSFRSRLRGASIDSLLEGMSRLAKMTTLRI